MALTISTDLIDSSGKELLEYGTRDFPAAFFYDDFRVVNVPWHWHNELELIRVLEGSQLVTIGSDSFTLHAGDGYFCNSGILHKADSLTEVCIQEAIVFHPAIIGGEETLYYRKYALPLLQDAGFPCIKLAREIPWQSHILDHIHDAWTAGSAETPGFEMTVRYLLGSIMLSFISNRNITSAPLRSSSQIRAENRVKRMLVYIEDHFADPLTIDEIAASADISVSECLRAFRSILRTTPVHFLNQYRLDKAGSLLRSSDLPVSEIADMCGFPDVSYFARAFKRAKGCTPTAFRKKRTSD